jgi:hypothetical protein
MSRLGLSIVNSSLPPGYVVTALPFGELGEAVEADLVANHFVMIMAMTGQDPSSVLNHNRLCSGIMSNCRQGVFRTRVPRSTLEKLFGRAPDNEMLSLLLFMERRILIKASLAELSPSITRTMVQDAQAAINDAIPREVPRSIGQDPRAYAYMDWEFTLSGDFYPDGDREESMRNMVRFTIELSKRVAYVRHFLFADCRRKAFHYRGILRMAVPVTAAFITDSFGTSAISVEPVTTNVIASYAFLESKRTSDFVGIPDVATVIAEINASDPVTAESLYFAGSAHTSSESERAARNSIDQGVPWYAIRQRGLDMSQSVIEAMYLRSKGMARAKARTWDYDFVLCRASNPYEIIARYSAMFGLGCVFDTRRGLKQWSGEPVIICSSYAEYGETIELMGRRVGRVVAIIVLHIAVDRLRSDPWIRACLNWHPWYINHHRLMIDTVMM